MPAPSRATLPCAERRARRQRGAAVVLALIAVSLAAMLAAAALGDFGHALESVGGRRDQAQSRQLARAAVDWTRNVLAEDQRTSATDHRGEIWAVKVPPTPLTADPADGTVGGEIIDLSGRFNLNDLAPGGQPDRDAHARLQRLLELLGDSAEDARRASLALGAWISAGGSGADGAPRTALLALDELSRLPGFDPARIARLAPFLATVPAPSRINVNTAPAEVLAALIPGLSLDAARVLVAERERAWFRDLADFGERLPDGAGLPDARLADVRSRYFHVTIHASYGVALTRLEALLDRRETWPELLWYRLP